MNIARRELAMMLYRYQDIQIMHLHLPFLANIA